MIFFALPGVLIIVIGWAMREASDVAAEKKNVEIIVRLDVMLARRTMTSWDLAQVVGITEQNLAC